MVVKLPCWAGCLVLVVGWWVRPILENSTACTCHMPILSLLTIYLVGGGLFWINSMDVSLIFVFGQIELAWPVTVFPVGLCIIFLWRV